MLIKELQFQRAEAIQKPSWEHVNAAISCLDGIGEDGIVLQSDGQSYMGISGGKEGRFAVIGFIDGYGEFICASGKEGVAQQVVVAGDYNTFASRHVVGLASVLIAARDFFERGKLSEQLKWEKSV
jgi:hypothetical protein